VISCPLWPSIGQNLPERQREHFSFDGISTVFLNLPYFRRGMEGCVSRRYSMLTHHSVK
jgi:hypothetical protein